MSLHNLGHTEGPGRKEVALGLFVGFIMLVAAAATLSVMDPYLRGPGGPIFSFSALVGEPS